MLIPGVWQSHLRCADCGAVFLDSLEKLVHRRDAHGVEEGERNLPEDM